MLIKHNKSNSIAYRAEMARRVSAFSVTSLCVFVLFCLVWPVTVSEFRSVAALNVASSKDEASKEKLEQSLARIIQEETVDERLDAFVSQIEVAGKLHSKQIEFRDHNSIRKALQVSISDRDYGYDFRLGYDGRGGDDERELVKMLATRIANRLNPDAKVERSSKSNSQKSVETLARLQSQQKQSFELATWIVEQIENDLKSVKLTLNRIGEGDIELQDEGLQLNNGASQFQFASSKKVVEDTSELRSTIESIDLRSLRDVLTEIRRRTDIQASMINANASSSSVPPTDVRIIVNNPNQVQTRPLRGTPGFASLILLGLVSVVLGAVVALKIQPFESRGFENARSVGSLLGVPVVAQMRADAASRGAEQENRRMPWANRVVASAGLILFGIIVVVTGFVLINPEVRDAFYENPLFGCAKIMRIFAGY